MPSPHTRYAPGVDGLRAVAVGAVLVYHLRAGALPGGFLGVDVFFVISGYLITDLLARQVAHTGAIDLPRFLLRRAQRLLPALAAMLVVVTATAVMGRVGVDGLRGDVLAAITYTSNWHEIGGESYFSQFGPPPLLRHLWSLAVEEQFYLVWPLLLAALSVALRRRGRVAAVAAGGALASSVAMGVLFTPGADPSRLYYGTDTHASGLLIGATLALLLPSTLLGSERVAARHVGWDLLGGLGLVGVAVSFAVLHDTGTAVYRGGFLALDAAAGLVVLAATVRGGLAERVLGAAPLRWIGRRSYAVYLWHWPVIALTIAWTGPRQGVGSDLVQVGVSGALAALSWRLLEDPIRRNGFAATLRSAVGALRISAAPIPRIVAGWGTVGLALIACIGVALGTPSGSNGTQQQVAAGTRIVHRPAAIPPPKAGPVIPSGASTSPPSSPTLPPSPPASRVRPTGAPAAAGRPHPARGSTPRAAGSGVSAFGDSVMLASAAALHRALPGMQIDAAVGRQPENALSRIRQAAAAGRLGTVVVIDLGTNGEFSAATLDRMLTVIGPQRRVLLLTVWVPRSWQNQVNAVLAAAARTHRNVTLVDWHRAVAAHQSLLWADDVHPRPSGARLYASLISAALPTSAR